jgi:hypothetical protein
MNACVCCNTTENLSWCPFALEFYCEGCFFKGQEEAQKEINAEFDRLHAESERVEPDLEPAYAGDEPWF